ncbi:polysaccharide deacetylase family protein [Paenibacillus sp. MMS18-CY102]|uniref:polysaccharide deacetylase family protein n=1 Tax=Paenibacillus sp. MMS18-CY102 TaxID=2682849 RepID=UPI0013661017|nr:polysaccharide deacetylase family protein [Paenibacillus sp. MMS18-CY102]MWC29412.1 polysaccharide deacetylase family protein [Paenibacillus sp. MMS18-CY102]
MENYTVQMIELLALKQSSTGYQMELIITRNDGHVFNDALEIDTYTYDQLSLLQPLGNRVRLSLYAKWDPYQRSYYSTLVRVNGAFRETLYFACSEDYVSQLKELKQFAPQEASNAAETVGKKNANRAAAGEASAVAVGTVQLGQNRWTMALRWLVIGVMLLLLILRANDLLFNDPAIASSSNVRMPLAQGPTVTKIETNGVGLAPSGFLREMPELLVEKQEPNKLAVSTPEAKPEGKPAVKPVKHPAEVTKPKQGYEIVKLPADKYTYDLPKGYVALTFDDGPSAYTKQLVDILKDNDVAGTFLFIGNNAKRHPDIVEYAYTQSMSVGNHSWDHSKLTRVNKQSSEANITKANGELNKDGAKSVTLFRPPYGLINEALASVVKDQQMKVLMWNRDPEDWDANTRDEIIDYFEKVNPSGGIYVLHEKKHTVEALPAIIQYLKKKQLKFVIFQ